MSNLNITFVDNLSRFFSTRNSNAIAKNSSPKRVEDFDPAGRAPPDRGESRPNADTQRDFLLAHRHEP